MTETYLVGSVLKVGVDMVEFLLARWPTLLMLAGLALLLSFDWLMTSYSRWRVARKHRHAAEILGSYRSLLRAHRTNRRQWLTTLRPRPFWWHLSVLWRRVTPTFGR